VHVNDMPVDLRVRQHRLIGRPVAIVRRPP
jgi:hypothetical protein